MASNQRRQDGKTPARSVHTTMMPADIREDDEEYKRDVEKIEAVQESRGNYILGQGALDKNDSAFLLEEEEKRMLALKRKAASERQMFADMVAKSRSAEVFERETLDVEGNVGKKGLARKRVKDMISLSTAGTKKDIDKTVETIRNDDTKDSMGSESENGLQGLLGDYGDSSDESAEGETQNAKKPEKKCKELPSALDVL